MGIWGRDYYRDEYSSRGSVWSADRMTPVIKYLIIINVVVFLLQLFFTRPLHFSEFLHGYSAEADRILAEKDTTEREMVAKLKKVIPQDELEFRLALARENPASIVQDWLELETTKVVYGGQIWRLLTHAFCHDRSTPFHILFNMLLLFWFGSKLESMYGSREFLLFYLTAAVAGGLAYVALDLWTQKYGAAIGASGAVMGVMMLYTMHFPFETLYLFFILRIQMRWAMLLYLIIDLHPVLLALAGTPVENGIANAAHLGGLAFGFLYYRYHWRLEPLADRIQSFARWPRWRRRPRLRLAPQTVPAPEPDVEMERVDELLQKIYESGQASLTDEERALLEKASHRLRNRTRS